MTSLNPLYLAVIFILSLLYLWSIYHIPILAVGIRQLRKGKRQETSTLKLAGKQLPTFSIVVPAKDEEKVISRLLEALLKLDYPREKREIIVVEDGSIDKTAKICAQFVHEHPREIKLIRKSESNGKPSALNSALRHLKGDIVAIFDADCIPQEDAIMKAAEYFADNTLEAVQGRPLSINSEQNMLSKFISYEEAVRYEAYIGGKDVLGLFVPLTGSCYFIRRSVLEALNGWNPKALSEDMELSARLAENGCKIRFASDVRCWQENPSNIRQLFKQRVRWFRGCMEVSLKYGKLLKRLDRKCIDAEVTLFGPFMFAPVLLNYALGLCVFFGLVHFDFFSSLLAQGATLMTTITFLLIGIALLFESKPRKARNVLWLPFVYAYWSIQSLVALYALVSILLNRPRKWTKTTKSGVIRNMSINHAVSGCISQDSGV